MNNETTKDSTSNEVKSGFQPHQAEIVSNAKLLEAGVYFGHKKAKWNPKMKPYISTTKKGIHIIDIQKTKKTLEFAYSIVKKFAMRDATFIFVGTSKQAKETIKQNALRTNAFYVSERWLGGTLTNNKTIFNSIKRMFELENMASNNFEGYTKKEGVLFSKNLAKLQKNLVGIKNMRSKPQVMIVADPKHDEIAVKEARKLGVKVVGIVDTNVDPNIVDIAIPANDDSSKSITLIMTILADAIAAAKGGVELYAYRGDSAIVLPEEIRVESNDPARRRRFNRNFDDRRSGPYQPRVTRTISNNNVVAASGEASSASEPSLVTNVVNHSEMKVEALRELAKNKGIKGAQEMNKNELLDALK